MNAWKPVVRAYDGILLNNQKGVGVVVHVEAMLSKQELNSHRIYIKCLYTSLNFRDFPGGAVVKNPPANAGDTGSSSGPGRSHMPRGH